MTVGVYGLGRFGGFWARCLSSRFPVLGWSRDSSRPTPEGVQRVSEEEVLSADAVVLCVSISAMEGVLRRIAGRIKPGSLLMDTCSVKVHPVRVMKEILPSNVSILATHPMFGPDSGSGGIEGLPLVFCPVRMNEALNNLWYNHFKALGLKVLEMTPEEHDKEAAYTQGITHFIGRVLNELSLKESSMATVGYEDLRDIVRQTCNDSRSLFIDLQRFNPYTGLMREKVRGSIDDVLKEIERIEILGEIREDGS